ncbi:replication initiation protein [Burkholderia stagnalis]|nr:replication initiation protein [Burkholderia stagnalis]
MATRAIKAHKTAPCGLFCADGLCAPLLWAGLGGETLGSAGSFDFRFANPALCPLTPFGDGTRSQLQIKEANP